MEPLVITDAVTIDADRLSVSFTRALPGDADAAVAARTTPSVVELRCDTRGLGLTESDMVKIRAVAELRADARGTLRVTCDEHRSRAQNVAGARHRLAVLLRQALEGPEPPAPAPPEKRRRAGLIKGRASRKAGSRG